MDEAPQEANSFGNIAAVLDNFFPRGRAAKCQKLAHTRQAAALTWTAASISWRNVAPADLPAKLMRIVCNQRGPLWSVLRLEMRFSFSIPP